MEEEVFAGQPEDFSAAAGDPAGSDAAPATDAADASAATDATTATALPGDEPSEEERTWAMLSYVLGLAAPIIAPMAIYLTRRPRSRFVAFHALQSLFMHLGLVAVTAAALAASYTLMVIPIAGWFLARQLQLVPFLSVIAVLLYSVVCALRAYDGRLYRVPMIADCVERDL